MLTTKQIENANPKQNIYRPFDSPDLYLASLKQLGRAEIDALIAFEHIHNFTANPTAYNSAISEARQHQAMAVVLDCLIAIAGDKKQSAFLRSAALLEIGQAFEIQPALADEERLYRLHAIGDEEAPISIRSAVDDIFAALARKNMDKYAKNNLDRAKRFDNL